MPQPRTPRSPDTPERTRYFPRQTVLPADLTLDRDYLLNRARRHNRVLHGWGVWFGLEVMPVPAGPAKPGDPQSPEYAAFVTKAGRPPTAVGATPGVWLAVAPGYALTPLGDEISLPGWTFLNTAREVDGALVTAPAACTSLAAAAPTRAGATLLLVVEVVEDETRPVRAAGSRCGDHADQYEFSRLADGVRFRLTAVPKPEADTALDPYASPPPNTDSAEGDLVRTVPVRRLAGRVQREAVRLGAVTFDADGKLTAPVATPGNRDVFKPATVGA